MVAIPQHKVILSTPIYLHIWEYLEAFLLLLLLLLLELEEMHYCHLVDWDQGYF